MDYYENGYHVIKIVITGGPCSGKTTAMDILKESLEEEGYHILTMPETATQLIGNGISPLNCPTMVRYQYWQMRMQYAKEKVYAGAAEEIAGELGKPILILQDRGMLDNKAYVEDGEFEDLLKDMALTEEECLSWYDAVFHLVTAAKGAEDFYTTSNNSSRTETAQEAADRDDCTLHAWENHPERIVIDNSTDFQRKIQRLIDGIKELLHQVRDQ